MHLQIEIVECEGGIHTKREHGISRFSWERSSITLLSRSHLGKGEDMVLTRFPITKLYTFCSIYWPYT